MTVASVLPECLTIPVRKKKLYFVSFSNILSSKSSIYNVRYIFIDAPVKIKINLYVRSISRIDDVKMVIKCIQNLLHVFLDVSNLKTVFLQPKLIFNTLNVIQSCVCISKCIQCILGGDIHTTPTIVRINTFLRSIDKIDDYKMVSQKKIAPIHFEHILYCNMKYKCVIITQLVFYLYYES